jgi:ABC-type nitrate/sulfonate/bicarbonate transport system ATPase subunit
VAVAVSISDLNKRFVTNDLAELVVLKNISFEVKQNELICILGPSGCGKSTILNILSGLEAPTAGEARLFAKHPDRPSSVGYIFQEPRLLPWRTVQDNLQFVLKPLSLPADEEAHRISDALSEVGLSQFAKAYPYQLSGGMQSRVAIARALATDPELLLMDEPFSSLDELTARSMRKLFLRLWESRKKTILFVTHNIFEATFLADRIIIMSANPGEIYKIIVNELPRPRDYEDPEVFAASARIAKDFMNNVVRAD